MLLTSSSQALKLPVAVQALSQSLTTEGQSLLVNSAVVARAGVLTKYVSAAGNVTLFGSKDNLGVTEPELPIFAVVT